MNHKVHEIRDPQVIAEIMADWLADHPEIHDADKPDKEWYAEQDAEWQEEKRLR